MNDKSKSGQNEAGSETNAPPEPPPPPDPKAGLDELPSLTEFLFETPLYKRYVLPDPDIGGPTLVLFGRFGNLKMDSFCSECGREVPWSTKGIFISRGDAWKNIRSRQAFDSLEVDCHRGGHKLRLFVHIDEMVIQKVGQYPSLANIKKREIAPFLNVLSRQDRREIGSAIGLAAHGVGIGSFVYLRRVFERIVFSRFAEFKAQEGWIEKDFTRLNMVRKVKHLKGHLPQFLVKNARVYAVLSKGIHELTEEECLEYFHIMKHSILMIMADDKKKKEELEMRAALSGAISGIDLSTS